MLRNFGTPTIFLKKNNILVEHFTIKLFNIDLFSYFFSVLLFKGKPKCPLCNLIQCRRLVAKVNIAAVYAGEAVSDFSLILDFKNTNVFFIVFDVQ